MAWYDLSHSVPLRSKDNTNTHMHVFGLCRCVCDPIGFRSMINTLT